LTVKKEFKNVQVNPRRTMVKSRGDTIVSLLYAAAAGDLSALKRHKVGGITTVSLPPLAGMVAGSMQPLLTIYLLSSATRSV
jgi:hypothetical protein